MLSLGRKLFCHSSVLALPNLKLLLQPAQYLRRIFLKTNVWAATSGVFPPTSNGLLLRGRIQL